MERKEYRHAVPSDAQIHPQHVFGSRPARPIGYRHFYSTMLPNRNRCIPLKIKIGDRFYSTINRGLRTHRLPRAARFHPQKGVKPYQMFSG